MSGRACFEDNNALFGVHSARICIVMLADYSAAISPTQNIVVCLLGGLFYDVIQHMQITLYIYKSKNC